ncbi:MAG TPA: VWA domain-containing protein [Dongiaceae bacterium]|nr:VWA domain-containing protein [Dongiaceae bacterium]
MSKVTDANQPPSIAGFGMLASALAGREIRVDVAAADMSAWTDGNVIFISSPASVRDQLAQICVQCALLAAGSLDRETLKQLTRRPKWVERYLAVEGLRALKQLQDLLPGFMGPIIEEETAKTPASQSPQSSLDIAKSQQAIGKPPQSFGSIQVEALLAAQVREGGAVSSGQHIPRKQQEKPLTELKDDADQDEEGGEDFTSPVGGGGGIRKLLQKMFQMVRRLKDGGSPGADAPTHWSRSGSRARARAVHSSARPETVEDAFGKGDGILYPEWNIHQHGYRLDWCSVLEIDPPADAKAAVGWLEGYGLRKPLSRLGMGLDRFHRQNQGDDIDIDAVIETQVERAAGSFPDESVYVESRRHRRDLSVLILLDISGSVAQASLTGASVHQQQRSVAAELLTVLFEVGDRTALYAFHSQGRSAVHMSPVKRFEETLDGRVMNRLYSLQPGAYSRLGAAIRHGSTVLMEQGGTSRKLLVVLSDGLAYDHGYEPVYAAADVRQALGEARRDGMGCVCLSIGADTETGTLRRVFGTAAHATIPDPKRLGTTIGPLFRAALQAAESKRRVA